MENLKELVDLSIQEIVQPLDQLGPESPTASVFSQYTPQSPPQIMAGNVNQPAWRARIPLNLATPLHDLPKHPERVLPKFDLGKGVSTEDHLKSFYLTLNILNVENEDVVCRIFPYTFEPKASSWYFSLQAINSKLGWF